MTDAMLGAIIGKTGADFRIWSHHASLVELCLFDERGETELARISMSRGEGDVHHVFVEGLKEGARYGFRIHGPYDPSQGHWYDPSKLLIDPYATELDRPFVYDPRLGQFGVDTAALMPKAILKAHKLLKPMMPLGERTGFIYEVNVKALTMLHPDVPEAERLFAALSAGGSVQMELQQTFWATRFAMFTDRFGRTSDALSMIKIDHQDSIKTTGISLPSTRFRLDCLVFGFICAALPPCPNTVLDTKTTGLIYLKHVTSKPIPRYPRTHPCRRRGADPRPPRPVAAARRSSDQQK